MLYIEAIGYVVGINDPFNYSLPEKKSGLLWEIRMEKLEWDESFCINVNDMDKRMEVFFQLVNRLGELKEVKRKKEDDFDNIAEALADITEFMREHFNHEERLLVRHKYPELNYHKKEHKKFLKKVMAFRRLFPEEPEKISADAYGYVGGWIMDHIKNDDMRFAPYVRVQEFLNEQKTLGRRGRS